MRLHFLLTCIAYMFFGVGMTVQYIGIKAGLGFNLTIGIFASSLVFFMISAFTSMEKVKSILFKKEKKDNE